MMCWKLARTVAYSGSGRYVSNVGQSLGGLKNALVGFGSGNPVGRFIAKTGGVAGQILSGIAGPNGLDLGGMAGGVKNFLGAGKTVIGNGLSNAWQTVRWRVQHPKSAAAL